MHILGRIGIASIVLASASYATVAPIPALPDQAQAFGYRLGTLIPLIFIPWLIAYPIAGRKKARKPNLFAGLFCSIALLFLLLNAVGTLAAGSLRPETDRQKAGRLMREAAGLQPVPKSFFGEEKTDTKLRDFFKQIIVINKDYQKEIDKLDLSATGNLNTPKSFANPDSVADGLRELHAAYDLDARQEQRMAQALENFRRSFDDLSPSEREAMIKGFETGLDKAMPIRQRAVSTEKVWIDAVDDVYDYARAHHSAFVMSDGYLRISNHDVLQEFNKRIGSLNAARKDFTQAKAAFDHFQNQLLQKNGLSRDQTGLH